MIFHQTTWGTARLVDTRSRTYAMMTKLASVPIPGRSRRGNHASKTTRLMTAVDQPSDQWVWRETPWANTVQGVAPHWDWTSRPSPRPKRESPSTNGNTMRGRNDHVLFARHGVSGILWLSLIVRATLVAPSCVSDEFEGRPVGWLRRNLVT